MEMEGRKSGRKEKVGGVERRRMEDGIGEWVRTKRIDGKEEK